MPTALASFPGTWSGWRAICDEKAWANANFPIRLPSLSIQALREYWIFRLGLNLLGYASVGVPILALIFLVKKRGLLDRFAPESTTAALIRKLIYGEEGSLLEETKSAGSVRGNL